MDPKDVQFDVVYRSERGGFDIRAVRNPDYREPPAFPYWVQTRSSAQWPWARPVSQCNTVEATRERVATYLNWDHDPSMPR